MTNRIRTRRLVAATGAAGALLIGGAAASAQAATASSSSSSSSASSVLAKIRYCESSNNYQAQNSSSTASGAYQFLDSTWRGLSAAKGYSRAMYAPASVQDAAALELYQAAGTSPWAASESCWAGLGAVPTTSTSTSSTASTSTSAGTSSSTTSSDSGTTASTTSGSGSATKAAHTVSARHTAKAPAKANPAPRKDGDKPAPGAPAPKGHRHHAPHHAAPAPRS